MRIPLLAAALIAAAAPLPAMAQDDSSAAIAEAADAMRDPAMQEQAGLMAAALVGVLLEMPVGPLMEAAAKAGGTENPDVDPHATVRDMLGPQAADAPEMVAERMPQMLDAMAGMAGAMGGAMEAMMPQLRDLAERLPRRLPESR